MPVSRKQTERPHRVRKSPGPPPTPSSSVNLWDFVQRYALLTNLTTLCALSDQCASLLKSGSQLTTLFAPTDSAFAELPVDKRAELWEKNNTELRDAFLLGHFVFGDILSTALKPSQDLETRAGTTVHVLRFVIRRDGCTD